MGGSEPPRASARTRFAAPAQSALMRSTRIGSFSASRAERLLSIAQQRQASAMETAPAADPDHPPRAEQGSAQHHDRRGGRFAPAQMLPEDQDGERDGEGRLEVQEERSGQAAQASQSKQHEHGG